MLGTSFGWQQKSVRSQVLEPDTDTKPGCVEAWTWRKEDANHAGKCITRSISFLQRIQISGKPSKDCFHTTSSLGCIGGGGAWPAHLAAAPSPLPDPPHPSPAASPTPWPGAGGAVEAQSILTLIASEVFEQHFKSFLPQRPSRTNKVFVVGGVKNSSK